MVGMALVGWLVLPPRLSPLRDYLMLVLENAGDISLDSGNDVSLLLGDLFWRALQIAAPPLCVIGSAGIVAAVVQNPPRLVVKRIHPDWSRISLQAGWSRLFGATGRTELVKQLMKVVGLGILTAVFLAGARSAICTTWLNDPDALPTLIEGLAVRYLMVIASAFAVLAGLDLIWTRHNWLRKLRMSLHEVKRELRESVGNPQIKARMIRIARGRNRGRMLTNVARATLVVANPTHFSVALRYVQAESGVPLVIAKGQDLMAVRIRAIAEANNIPVIEDVALARSLYRSTDVDAPIPTDFYRAVAEILVYLRKAGGTPTRRTNGAR